MSALLKDLYLDVEIEYDTDDDKWCFELYGKGHRCATLSEARKAIRDTPKPKKPFERISVYYSNNSATVPTLETVTSETDAGRRDWVDKKIYRRFWVSNAEGRRRQEPAKYLFEVTEANRAKVAKLAAMKAEIEARREAMEAIYKTLEPAFINNEVTKEVEENEDEE